MNNNDLEHDYAVCDDVLKKIAETDGGYVSLLHVSEIPELSNQHEVLSFLVEEGLLDKSHDSYHITHKGRIVIHEGGFQGKLRRARLMYVCTIIAAVSGVIAAIAGVAALLT